MTAEEGAALGALLPPRRLCGLPRAGRHQRGVGGAARRGGRERAPTTGGDCRAAASARWLAAAAARSASNAARCCLLAVAGFDDASGLRASGIMVAGKKYMYLRNDEEMMCGKQGQGGICIFKTGQALIMGTYNQDMSPANNTKEVGKMADYLKEVGY